MALRLSFFGGAGIVTGNTIIVGLGNAYVRRLNSLDYTNVALGGSTGQTLTIGGSSTLTVTKHSTPPDPNTVAPGSTGATIGTFVIGNQASGSETVRINRNLLSVNREGERVSIDFYNKFSVVSCRAVFEKFLVGKGFSLNKVKLIHALIHLNMSPLHHKPFDELLYYLGKLELYQCLYQKG
jgi:hypothetical protein